MPQKNAITKKSVMIVDDEVDIIRILRNALLQRGLSVSTFTNPIHALTQFELNSQSFALLVTDIRMPEMTGFELARRVRELNPEVKILLMTAYEITPKDIEQGLLSSPSSFIKAEQFIKKPLSMSEFADIVQKHLKNEKENLQRK